MSKRVLRAGLFGIPLFAMGMAVVAACGDDPANPDGTGDASSDVPVIDGSTAHDGNTAHDDGSTITDAGTDSKSADADADADAPSLPPLCQTYTNTGIVGDAAAEGTDPIPRWDLIAFRALEEAALTCEVGAAFQDNFGDPTAYECLGKQLANIVGCAGVLDYSTANDSNGTACAPDAGNTIQLGFRNPGDNVYYAKDVDFFIALVEQAAEHTGIPSADAARLIDLLQARKNKVVGSSLPDGGGDGGDFSQSSCP